MVAPGHDLQVGVEGAVVQGRGQLAHAAAQLLLILAGHIDGGLPVALGGGALAHQLVVLASSDSYMAGPSNRRNNIRLAAAAVDGSVLMPGETFSYNRRLFSIFT